MKRIIQIGGFGLILALMTACGEEPRATESQPESPADHETEARETITAENMDQHLDELEAEISADETIED